ncbi:MAG: hypothetical protein H7641_14860 [Candidatus Heimdallarchaeota archaeon]|nr:hypothetical protein [Candidatus Heimdallarchaeota archaeon]MCK4878843.1 hypothetical protein [Candidatus Heimdallarchaeota archaeon]
MTSMEIGRYYTEDSKKRIVSLDFMRGAAIWMMVFFHASTHMYDYTWVADRFENLYTFPLPILIFLLILLALGGWATFFILISASVNSFSMTKRAMKGADIRVVLYKQLFTGFGILFIGWLVESFIGMHGYLGYAIRDGDWTNLYPAWKALFVMKALQIIGWSVIINSIIHFLLMRNGGSRLYSRNLIIYCAIFLGIVIITPFAHQWVDQMNWLVPETLPIDSIDYFSGKWPDQYVQTLNASPRTFILVWLVGDQLPLFPCIGASFIGSIIGMTLSKEKPSKRILLWGSIIGLVMVICGIVLIVLGFSFLPTGRPSIASFLLQIGTQLLVVILFLRLVEFRGKAAKFAKNPVVKYFRLWSMVSLSVFCLQIYEMFGRWLLTLIVSPFRSINFLQQGTFGYHSVHWPMIAALFVIFCFDILLRLWARINFVASFEWFVIRFQGLATKDISPRLDVDLMMNRMKWISFNEKESEE